MATLTDIALNDPTAVAALARNPLSLVGTAADPTGTAAATAAADEAAITAFYGDAAPFRTATRNALKGIYADQERLLREQRVGMTKGERLLETLAAFGQPVSGGMGEALANAARTTTARNQSEREVDRARKDKLNELMLSQRLEIAKSDMSFGEKALERLAEQAKGRTPDQIRGLLLGKQMAGGKLTPAEEKTLASTGPAPPAPTDKFATGRGADLMQKYPDLKGLDPDQTYKFNLNTMDVALLKQEAEKPALPVQALARQTTLVGEAGTFLKTANEAQDIIDLLASGELKLNPIENAASVAKNAAGLSDPNSNNYAKLDRFVSTSVNAILQLAKGTQTEGDAKRAQAQILKNRGDPGVVASALGDLRKAMLAALTLRDAQVQGLYRNYNAEPFTLWETMGIEAPAGYAPPKVKGATPSRGAAPPPANDRRAAAIKAELAKRDAKGT